MAKKTINSWNVVDTEGRVWRRYAIPEGVTLANGLSKEKIEEELRQKMEQVGVKVMEPVLMKWTEEGASVLRHRIVVPLVFVAGCYDKWMVAVYEKAYERFLATLSSSEKAQNGGVTRY